MNKKLIASLVGLAFTSPFLQQTAFAAEQINLDEVTVKANRFERKDTETTYASEIHTAKQIEASGATSLYDYLAQQTSLNVLSNFGSKATPAVNLRGYGSENGYQNVVITLDGQRLNTIDLNPQLLGAIPLGNIDRIEISKGSGSVIYGDGATAGAIQIYTKNKTGVTVSGSLGNYGQISGNVLAGISEQYFDLTASVAHDSHDGFSKKAADGQKDTYESNAQNVKLRIKPIDALKINLEATNSITDLRYPSSLTQAQFNDDPSQNGKPLKAYTHQHLESEQWRAGFEYDITKEFKLSATHYQEDKKSKFTTFVADYDYISNDIALSFQNDVMNAIVGFQNFDGQRNDSFNISTKDNKAYFAEGEYRMDALTISAGARKENVKYHNQPTTDDPASGNYNLHAWDIGANYRLNNELSVFTNYNKSFQAPDIDRSFVFDNNTFQTVFSGFIKPADVRTLNIGLNHDLANNAFKAVTYYSKLKNEIYLVPSSIDPTFKNTNLDKSHKYGLELQDSYQFNNQLSASVIYNYTRAIIDKEDDGAGTFNGKNLPGVPKHTIVANLNYKFFDHASLNVNQTWRSTAYALNDFQNNFTQKQDSYQTTNLALNYQYKNLLFFTAVNNLFEHENSIQVKDNGIYPVDFVRTWRVGMKADF